jgi:hypothetical protein
LAGQVLVYESSRLGVDCALTLSRALDFAEITSLLTPRLRSYWIIQALRTSLSRYLSNRKRAGFGLANSFARWDDERRTYWLRTPLDVTLPLASTPPGGSELRQRRIAELTTASIRMRELYRLLGLNHGAQIYSWSPITPASSFKSEPTTDRPSETLRKPSDSPTGDTNPAS